MIFALLVLLVLVSAAAGLGRWHRVDVSARIAQRVDALLPQTQCTACGFNGCRPYAEAISQGRTGINRCVPGGKATVETLASMLGEEPEAVRESPDYRGVDGVALIDEDVCIGCTKCIQACPVDAIIGASKQMHVVLESMCTGCGLCIPPCPVDCIEMQAQSRGLVKWQWPAPV